MGEGARREDSVAEKPARLVNLATLALRLALGIVMFPHGAQKLLGWFGGRGLMGTIHGFAAAGISAPFAFLNIVAEFFGPLGLVTGLLTRLAAFGIGVVMVVAALRSNIKYGFFMNWSGKFQGEGIEYHILALGIAVALLLMGGGAWSLDRILWRKLSRRSRRGRS
jgi:putative oxidoreductase